MKAKKTKHPRFDEKTYQIDVTEEESWSKFFAGQPLVLARAFKSLSKSGKRVLTGAAIREFLETQKNDLFPGTSHKDPLRIFLIYSATLRRHGVVREIAE
jgi:hypothetical protein